MKLNRAAIEFYFCAVSKDSMSAQSGEVPPSADNVSSL